MAKAKDKTAPAAPAKVKPPKPRADEKWLHAVWTEKVTIRAANMRERGVLLDKLKSIQEELRAFAKRSKRTVREFRLVSVSKSESLVIALFVTRMPRSGTLERLYTPRGPLGPKVKLTYRKIAVRKPKND